MKLVVEILTGSLFYVEAGEDDTVGDLKEKIGNQENLPSDRLILMLDVQPDQHYLLANDEISLKDYAVQDGSHIYIFFQPCGDGNPSSPIAPQGSVPNPIDVSNEGDEIVEKEPSNALNTNDDVDDESSDEADEDVKKEPSNEADEDLVSHEASSDADEPSNDSSSDHKGE